MCKLTNGHESISAQLEKADRNFEKAKIATHGVEMRIVNTLENALTKTKGAGEEALQAAFIAGYCAASPRASVMETKQRFMNRAVEAFSDLLVLHEEEMLQQVSIFEKDGGAHVRARLAQIKHGSN